MVKYPIMGRSTTRDKKTGRFTSATLDSDTARAMGKIGTEQQRGTSRDKLLAEAGYGKGNPAPELYRVVAQQATKTPAGMALWVRLTQPDKETPGVIDVLPGEMCPMCKQYVLQGMQMTEEELGNVMEYVQSFPSNEPGSPPAEHGQQQPPADSPDADS